MIKFIPLIKQEKFFIDFKNPRCPSCKYKLYSRYHGLVCKNVRCGLRNKLERGWVLLTNNSNWSKKRHQINDFFDSNTRLMLQKRWVHFKLQIIRRDDYTCTKCGFNKGEDWDYKNTLQVHHIIAAFEEMALYFDEDNCITLCEDCHSKIHKFDKRSFSKK